jgi:hypothetical protein
VTRYLREDGTVSVSWDTEAEPVDWTTPNTTWHGHEFCGNCGWDAPGCGCPRDDRYQGSNPGTLPVQRREDPPLPSEPKKENAGA